MPLNDLDRPASLGIWPSSRQGGAVPVREYATLREALGAAVGALSEAGAHPWIVTEAGAVLSPRWIEARTGKRA